MNLVRLRIATASAPSVVLRPLLTKNWNIISISEQRSLLAEIESYLQMPRFGEFYAFRSIFGDELAQKLGKQNTFALPST